MLRGIEKMSDGGKGSAPRKQQDHEAYGTGYDRIFRKKLPEQPMDELVRISEELGLYDDLKDGKED